MINTSTSIACHRVVSAIVVTKEGKWDHDCGGTMEQCS